MSAIPPLGLAQFCGGNVNPQVHNARDAGLAPFPSFVGAILTALFTREKPPKHCPDFPLYPHAQWARKIN